MATDILLLVGAYLVGALPFGYMLTKFKTGKDIRTEGSGNIGATNVLRTQGKVMGFITLVLDFAKAALAVWACREFGHFSWMAAAGGLVAVVGHCYPVYIGFRGGKGIASALGAFTFISPEAALGGLLVWLGSVLTVRIVSVASILGSLTFGVLLFVFRWTFAWYDLASCFLGLAVAVLVVWRHKKNINNLLAGTERRIWGDKPRPVTDGGTEGSDG